MSKDNRCEFCGEEFPTVFPFYIYLQNIDLMYKYYGCIRCVTNWLKCGDTTSLGGGEQKYDKSSINS